MDNYIVQINFKVRSEKNEDVTQHSIVTLHFTFLC